MEQEYPQPEETTQKKYIRNYTEEGREKQKFRNYKKKSNGEKKRIKRNYIKS